MIGNLNSEISNPKSAVTYRQAMAFAVEGDVRFLSHADTLRLFARAMARAGLPVHHSAGFNPHPQISIPLPRSVGMASVAERVVIGLDEPVPPEEARARLQAQMPEGIRITRAWELAPSDSCQPVRVAYSVELPAENSSPAAQDGVLAGQIGALLERGEFTLERKSPKHRTGKRIDIRPYIDRLELRRPPASDANPCDSPLELHMWLRVTPQGTVRPVEVCKALGIPTDAIQHRVRRMEVE